MTERSVQIWFQNTRAKQKKAKAEPLEDVGAHHMDSPLSDSSSLDFERRLSVVTDTDTESRVSRSNSVDLPFDHVIGLGIGSELGLVYGDAHAVVPDYDTPVATTDPMDPLASFLPSSLPLSPQQSTAPVYFSCMSLTIGNWKRLSTHGAASPELSLAYYPATDSMAYHMTSEDMEFRIQFPFSLVEDVHVADDCMHVTLSFMPSFAIMTPKVPGQWINCHDFSESKQASTVLTHTLQGASHQLQQQLSRVFALRANSNSVRCMTPVNMASSSMPFCTPLTPDMSDTSASAASVMSATPHELTNTPMTPFSGTFDTLDYLDSSNPLFYDGWQ